MDKENKDVMREFSQPISKEDEINIIAIKGSANHLYEFINNLGLGDCREIALANTKIEEAVMWAVKAITRARFPN
jgi:hypothetical protein